MKTIDRRTGEGYEHRLYPDNQPHVKLVGIEAHDRIKVIWPIKSSLDLVQLLMVQNAAAHAYAIIDEIHVPYLMGARSDRVMEPGDSFDLQVVAYLLNLFPFRKLFLYDVHSEVATTLISNSVNVNNRDLVEYYDMPDAVLIVPDKGAVQKAVKYPEWNKNLTSVVYCDKHRDLSNGNITLKVQEPEKCLGRNCIIIDDLCDGGGTFLAIADQIQPSHLTLMVTHGIFSKGLRKLEEKFQSIITTDSYYGLDPFDSKILKVKPLNI